MEALGIVLVVFGVMAMQDDMPTPLALITLGVGVWLLFTGGV